MTWEDVLDLAFSPAAMLPLLLFGAFGLLLAVAEVVVVVLPAVGCVLVELVIPPPSVSLRRTYLVPLVRGDLLATADDGPCSVADKVLLLL